MKENLPATIEHQDAPSSEQVIQEFIDRRAQAQADLDAIQSKTGVNLDAIEIMNKRHDEKQGQTQVDELDEAWSQLGGDAIDAANRDVESLNFKSDASDHARTMTQLRDAKAAFYTAFMQHQAEASSDDMSQDNEDVKESEISEFDEAMPNIKTFPLVDIDQDETDEPNVKAEEDEPKISEFVPVSVPTLESEPQADRTLGMVGGTVTEVTPKKSLIDRAHDFRAGRQAKATVAAMKRSEGFVDANERHLSRKAKIGLGALAVGLVVTKVWLVSKNFDIDLNPFNDRTDLVNEVPALPSANSSGTMSPGVHEIASVFSSDAQMATNGEGWTHQLREMGIPANEHQAMFGELLKSNDPGIKDFVYQMKDGNPGISHQGKIPQNVLESIMKLRK